jgi:hypothetical protein
MSTLAFQTISPKQIQLLKDALSKARARSKLGIQNISQKEPKKAQRDPKKRGRKMDMHDLNTLGTRLVESGKYAQLTEFFPANTPSSQ